MDIRYISKGELSSQGMRRLISHVQDADGRWREETADEVPDDEAEARMDALIAAHRFKGRWGGG